MNVSGALFFNLLASQGRGTKLGMIIPPEKVLPVSKHNLRMILR